MRAEKLIIAILLLSFFIPLASASNVYSYEFTDASNWIVEDIYGNNLCGIHTGDGGYIWVNTSGIIGSAGAYFNLSEIINPAFLVDRIKVEYYFSGFCIDGTNYLKVAVTADNWNSKVEWSHSNFNYDSPHYYSRLIDVVNGNAVNISFFLYAYGSGSSWSSVYVYNVTLTLYAATANNPPDAGDPYPPDGANITNTTVMLSCRVMDPDGDVLNVTFYNARTQEILGSVNNVASGSRVYCTWSGLSYYSSYEWFVRVSDGKTEVQSPTWHFNVVPPGHEPQILNVYPYDGAENVSIPVNIWFTVTDEDNDSMYVEVNIGITNPAKQWIFYNVTSGTSFNLTWDGAEYNTTYTLYIFVRDENNATNAFTGTFRTEPEDPAGGGGIFEWPRWRLPFSWFAMFFTSFIAIIGFASTAFFMKPESIEAFGYAPAAGSLLLTILIVAGVLLYHTSAHWVWLALDALLAVFVLYLTVKAVVLKKGKRYVRRLL